ncbi:unnamed protein product, partial [Polarella glacialis]
MLICFPSLALLVSCCPDPGIVSPEETGCPAEYVGYRDKCCSSDVANTIFRGFGVLSLEEVGYLLPDDPYDQVVNLVEHLMARYLRDTDGLSVDAWRLFSVSSLRNAIVAIDTAKERYVGMQTLQDAETLLPEALAASRQLARALFRMENYHAFLLGQSAARWHEKMQGFDPERLRNILGPAIEVYKTGKVSHDLFVYG